jgi:hypothetical protein
LVLPEFCQDLRLNLASELELCLLLQNLYALQLKELVLYRPWPCLYALQI